MNWFDQLADKVDAGAPQIINDSKTPSGRVHVGALRGVIIHDVVFRVLKSRGVAVRYQFGVDDYDPLDELPAGQAEHFEKYLGAPLCNVPPPPGSTAPDMAEHYIREFFDVFRELGVEAETYRMRDHYRSGKFNEVIDTILRKADVVREVYRKVSGSQRPETWYPFQVVCETCGRIGTTEVSGYDGKEVVYTCRPNLVKWAKGCGHQGKVSPFDGRGKLPWKLEWVAKWKTFPVTIEGAGKDHNTKGGARDVSANCLRKIFGQTAPLNIPYEFFLVGGAKMSSSKGLGATAREMADFLPPEVLRFLILRTQPQRPLNVSLDEEFIIKLFNDFDRVHHRAFHDPKASDDRQIYALSEIRSEGDCYDANFHIVETLVQMPHLDLVSEIQKRKGSPLTVVEQERLRRRVQAARYWLDHYAREEEKLRLQETLPARAQYLTAAQRAFLRLLADALRTTTWSDDALQVEIFNIARRTPIDQPSAFQAIYRVLIDKESGPKAGSFIAFLDRDFVCARFRELPYSEADLWRQTGLALDDFDAWVQKERDQIESVEEYTPFSGESGLHGIDLLLRQTDSKIYRKRVLYDPTAWKFKTVDDYVLSLKSALNRKTV